MSTCVLIKTNKDRDTDTMTTTIPPPSPAVADRMPWGEYFMRTAQLISQRSACSRLHVGCVLVRDNRIISAGYNGFLPGAPHRSRMRDSHEQATVHAEQNAVADCARRGVSTGGCVCYVTHYPCLTCAKILAAAGISQIYYHANYRNDTLVHEIMQEIGVRVEPLVLDGANAC